MISRAPRESDQDLSFFTQTKIPKFRFSTKFSILVRSTFFMCHFLVNIQQKLQCLVLTFLKHFLPPFSSLQLFALPSKGHDLLISINAQWVRSRQWGIKRWNFKVSSYYLHFLVENTNITFTF